MTPDVVAGIAALNGLDVFALTDHNSALNCPAAKAAAEAYGIEFIPGVEVTSAEDVHIVCLFPSCDAAMSFSEELYTHLPEIINRKDIFGEQLICNKESEICGEVEKLLIVACDLSVVEVCDLAKIHGGFSFPAHIEKESNGILPILGGIPLECDFPTVESKNIELLMANEFFKSEVANRKIISSSDAHFPHEILEGESIIEAEGATFSEIIKALSGVNIIDN